MAQQNKVRIIGGEWRRRWITFPVVEGLRPTSDRVRETLFNWLGQTLDGKTCLDLFAGSGALGFEALSRGAAKVVMVERERGIQRTLQENAAKLGARNLEIVNADALHFLPRETRRFDVIFLDPPFHKDVLTLLFPFLEARLNPDGLVYAESEKPLEPGPEWQIRREGRAGNVFYYLLAREGETA
ncbi:MAG: 16S rRNA (guanine(966)-N(2))-methyltransferase RsmD [Sulfuricella sp.]|nr:16S rRNA (guanine(966)-N(2))-methyltransferase RsmD [Sulfuricella sp.]